jgi:chloramphenicol-sensitive protein RarD
MSTETAAVTQPAPRGVLALLGAFTMWGVMVLYLRLLAAISPLQIMAYRLIFCCVFVCALLRVRGGLAEVRAALIDPHTRKRLVATSALISINWLVFTWAVTQGHVVESSLGYFINPLVNVLLGVVVLGERLKRAQWFAVSLAAAAVMYLTWLANAPPFIALILAVSFGVYGLLRKTVAVGALPGLAAETLIALPFGLAYVLYCELTGIGALQHADGLSIALLVFSGAVTAVPLTLFSYGARLVPYSTVGLLQYIGPTIQLLIGTLLLHEPFTRARAIGFVMIWAALAIYAADSLRQRRTSSEVLG